MTDEVVELARAFTTSRGTCWTAYRGETMPNRVSYTEFPSFDAAYKSMIFWNRMIGKPFTSLAQEELVFAACQPFDVSITRIDESQVKDAADGR